MEKKKYYWLKLKDNFFQEKEIKKLRKLKKGNTYTIIYLKMQLLSLPTLGKIYYTKVEDNFIEELSLELDEKFEDIKQTLEFLQQHQLISEIEQNVYELPQAVDSIAGETASAGRVRRFRAKNKTLQSNEEVLQSNKSVTHDVTLCNPDIDIHLDIKKDIDINARALDLQNFDERFPTNQPKVKIISDLKFDKKMPPEWKNINFEKLQACFTDGDRKSVV
jgi:predicted phage replisome organizer